MRHLKIALALTIALASSAFAGETMYVQPAKAKLLGEPKMNGAQVAELKRGDAVEVLKKEGLWFQVKSGKNTGYVSKLFVNDTKPVGEDELQKKLSGNDNVAKAARRRSSSYSVSAATRGLTAGNRVREGRETYESDYEAVKKMDELKVDKAELQRFMKAGGLGQ